MIELCNQVNNDRRKNIKGAQDLIRKGRGTVGEKANWLTTLHQSEASQRAEILSDYQSMDSAAINRVCEDVGLKLSCTRLSDKLMSSYLGTDSNKQWAMTSVCLTITSQHLTVESLTQPKQDRLLPPLEPDEYCQPEDSEQFNTQVVDWMRRRLIYFFMSPREKFYAKQRIPYKLFVQLLKVVLITMQLIVFGQDRSAHVSFGENSRLAFSHLYLRDWNPQYETLDYPPASGPYAAYQQDEFYLMLGYTITQFNKTESIAIGSYLFTSDKPFLTFCRVSVADRGLMTHTEETHCADLYPKDVPADSLSTASGVRQLLANYNLSVNFARLLKFTMEFEILSPIVTELGWRREAECFKFQIHISMEKIQQSGQLQIYLDAPYTATYCEEAEHTKPTRGRTEWLRHFWLTMSQTHRNLDNRTSEVSFSFSTRRMIIASLNSVVLVIGILSTVLCIRSIVRGFILWKETVLFFRHWYSIELRGHFWDFIPPWFIAIIFTDAIIIYGAVYNLWTLNG
ncbi:mucolipin-3, partial [Clonorchis sinensis]